MLFKCFRPQERIYQKEDIKIPIINRAKNDAFNITLQIISINNCLLIYYYKKIAPFYFPLMAISLATLVKIWENFKIVTHKYS